MRLAIQHTSSYRYPRPAALGPHMVRLTPAAHVRAAIEQYSLTIPQEHQVHWQRDPQGNRVARVTFPTEPLPERLDFVNHLVVNVRPVNPFDFFLEPDAEQTPFKYAPPLQRELTPFLDRHDPAVAGGPKLDEFLGKLPPGGKTLDFVVALNQAVNQRVRYVIREETGVWTPEECLTQGRGSCRDSAMLLVAAFRSRGLAARFVSGYLVQLTDEGLIPDVPKGVARDVVDLHAWAEVYLPGAGWVGLDATSGLLAGEGHIALACAATPALAAPLDGSSDVPAEEVSFSITVQRLGHEARPAAPIEDATWEALLAASDVADAKLTAAGLTLTIGGEPTFNSREAPDAPEWNNEAIGPSKWAQGWRLANELRERFCPRGVLLHRMGKWYPGESLPRWAIEAIGAADGPLWTELPQRGGAVTVEDARKLVAAIGQELGVKLIAHDAYEDPWRALMDEAALPVDVDPLTADLDDAEERKRLARLLDRGLGEVVGLVIPFGKVKDAWRSDAWTFRRGRLHLIPGDSPMGLRLPLGSLPETLPPPEWAEAPLPPGTPPDPRNEEDEDDDEVVTQPGILKEAPAVAKAPLVLRTAMCVEPRGDRLWVFVPPLAKAADFVTLVRAIDVARRTTGIDARLEGYPPAPGGGLARIGVAPDPGVLEVNVPPTATGRAHARQFEAVFDAARHSGLHAEKNLLDGRLAGSGGGNHITMGGPSPLESPFVRRPALLASVLTFVQHHPSLSFLFTGLFVGPTSQAPRVDEARHDALAELEIALARAWDGKDSDPPWLADQLFRNLLVDVTGNTHRTEISIDKLWSPDAPTGRQGLLELRAFEMPPHERMATAQALLARGIIAAMGDRVYRAPLVRWGQLLHDKFLLPTWLWRDFEDMLAALAARGVELPAAAYRPFLELKCPVIGQMTAEGVTLELRNAIEPWNVLGEEPSGGGTARYVDSSMERVEVRVVGLTPERHAVLVNGVELPLRATGVADERVGGVRFRAWAPPRSLQPHLGIHHPLKFDVVDHWAARSIGGCAYHVWHPEGRAYDAPPLTTFEASARRAARFVLAGPSPSPLAPRATQPLADAPHTLDLRRLPIDHPPPPEGREWREEAVEPAPAAPADLREGGGIGPGPGGGSSGFARRGASAPWC